LAFVSKTKSTEEHPLAFEDTTHCETTSSERAQNTDNYPLIAFPFRVNFALSTPDNDPYVMQLPGSWAEGAPWPNLNPAVKITIGRVDGPAEMPNLATLQWLESLQRNASDELNPEREIDLPQFASTQFIIDAETPNQYLDSEPKGTVSEILDRCLAAVNKYIKAYLVASESPFVYFLTHENLDFFQFRDLRTESLVSVGVGDGILTHDNVPGLSSLDNLHAERLGMLAHALRTNVSPHPMDAHRVWLARATRARAILGDYEQAVLYYEIAAEALLAGVRELLLVNDNNSAVEIRQQLDGKQQLAQVVTYLQQKLGGNWDGQGTGPFGEYYRDLYLVRNRIAHQARHVTMTELDAAQRGYEVLEGFVHKRVLEKRHILPMVAVGVFGWQDLIQRGKDSHRLRTWVRKSRDEPGPFWEATEFRVAGWSDDIPPV
jgi:hypothetical protein